MTAPARPARSTDGGHWSDRPEGGWSFTLWIICWIALRGGRSVARLLLWPITLYFLMARPSERAASRAYLSKALGRRAGLRDVARHIHTFAATILDRVFLLTRGIEALDVTIAGQVELHQVLDDNRGVLLLGSHLGSFEVLRALARTRPDTKVCILMKVDHASKVMGMLSKLNPEMMAGVIDVDQHPVSVVQAIRSALAGGALVTMLNDRCAPGEAGVSAPFFGEPMRLPSSALSIAAVTRAPVWLAFGLYRGGNQYDLLFEPFADPVTLPRGQRPAALQDYAARYAARLEHMAREAPYNWFNFYDVWDVAASDSDAQDQT